MFGVWMWPANLIRGNGARAFDACREAGVTDVFFLTKGLDGTTAFLSDLTPPMAQGRDLLDEALSLAHARGIRLHAWFTSASDARYKDAHPESGRCHYTRGRDKGLVSLTDAGYIGYMRRVIVDMLARYGVDGVHLDYIRYNHLLYGWSEEDMARYAAAGADIGHVRDLMDRTFYREEKNAVFDAFRSGDESVLRLAQVRRRDVNAFADALCGAVRSAGGGVTLSVALMPEGAYDDLAFADLHYGQHYADLASRLDCFLPMAYSLAYGMDPVWVGRVARGTVRHGVKTLMGLHAYEGGTGVTLAGDLAAIRGVSGVEGACLFREGAFVWAFVSDSAVTLDNPTDETVTRIEAARGAERIGIDVTVEPGGRIDAALPFRPECVRAFCDEKELCVYNS